MKSNDILDNQLLKDVILKYEINTQSRKREKVYARFVVCRYLRNYGWPLSKIGQVINRDHSTVLWALKQFELLKNEMDFKYIYSVVLRDLQETELTIENPLISEIEERILKCENYFQMRLLQEELIKKYK